MADGEEKTAQSDNGENVVQNDGKEKKFNIFSLIGLIFAVLGAIFEIVYFVGVSSMLYPFLACMVLGFALSVAGTVLFKRYRSGLVLGIIGIVASVLSFLAFAGFFILIIIILTGIGKA